MSIVRCLDLEDEVSTVILGHPHGVVVVQGCCVGHNT